MSEEGFNWLGEWVTKDESFSYPTWKIYCKKKSHATNAIEKQKILAAAQAFSQAYMNADSEFMANSYTPDGKIFPGGTRIIEGREAIKKFWTITDGTKVLHHKVKPEEVTFLGNYAYDFGYYEGNPKTARFRSGKASMSSSGKKQQNAGRCIWIFGTGCSRKQFI